MEIDLDEFIKALEEALKGVTDEELKKALEEKKEKKE